LQATSALDTITENSIQEALATLGRNRTVLMIAHRLSTVKHAQQIVVMDAGRVIEVGSHEQLLRDPNSTYSRMWDMQSHSTATVGDDTPANKSDKKVIRGNPLNSYGAC
jgi:ABC-type multidrug transport system fused ATPase/permease subunit